MTYGNPDEHYYGYTEGQTDVLAWLKQGPRIKDDYPFAAISPGSIQIDYALWCLGQNLTIAGALTLAKERGWWDGAGYHKRKP